MKGKLRPTLSWLAVVAIFTFPLLSLPGAVDMFLELDQIQGESQDKTHKNDIDVLAWSWGMSNSGTTHTGGGGGGVQANFQDLSVTKWVDKASPILMLKCATGDIIQDGKLYVRQSASQFEYIVIEMKQILVTSVSTGGSGGEDRLTENISLNFAQFKFIYVPQKLDGTEDTPVDFGWDIPGNKAP